MRGENLLRERGTVSVAGTIDAERLAKCCLEKGLRLRVSFVRETESTNSDAGKMLSAGTQENFAVVAGTQTAGRGRAGRSWASSEAGNIYLSCGFRPRISPSRMANFTLWIGVAIAQILREKFGVPAKVKWPNDIFCSGKKLAGILTEVHMNADCVHGVVLGVGLNVNLDPAMLPPDVRVRATSLRAERAGNAEIDVNLACAEILCGIENAYEKFVAGEHENTFDALWREYDLLAGAHVRAVYGNEEISGVACGVDNRGNILICVGDGVRVFSAGDVMLASF